jgi:hypothetical protein
MSSTVVLNVACQKGISFKGLLLPSRIQDKKKNGCSEPYDGLMAISGTFFSTLSVERRW